MTSIFTFLTFIWLSIQNTKFDAIRNSPTKLAFVDDLGDDELPSIGIQGEANDDLSND